MGKRRYSLFILLFRKCKIWIWKIKSIFEKKKNEEKERKEKSGKIYYNIASNNCHDFVYEIEKILFNKNPYYSFKYYLDEFYEYFFPKVDIKKLKLKYENDINEENKKKFKELVEKFNNDDKLKIEEKMKLKKNIENLYSLKWDDYLN